MLSSTSIKSVHSYKTHTHTHAHFLAGKGSTIKETQSAQNAFYQAKDRVFLLLLCDYPALKCIRIQVTQSGRQKYPNSNPRFTLWQPDITYPTLHFMFQTILLHFVAAWVQLWRSETHTPGFTVFIRTGSRKWRMTARVSRLVSPLTGVPFTSSSTSPLLGNLPAWQTNASETTCPRWGNSPCSAPPRTSTTEISSPEPPHDTLHSCTLVDQCFFFFSVLDIVCCCEKPPKLSPNVL